MVSNTSSEDLEKALSELSRDKKVSKPVEKAPEVSKEEEIGFHKGALNTLLAERNELIKMIGNIESIMQAHLKRLQELGVDVKIQQPENK